MTPESWTVIQYHICFKCCYWDSGLSYLLRRLPPLISCDHRPIKLDLKTTFLPQMERSQLDGYDFLWIRSNLLRDIYCTAL